MFQQLGLGDDGVRSFRDSKISMGKYDTFYEGRLEALPKIFVWIQAHLDLGQHINVFVVPLIFLDLSDIIWQRLIVNIVFAIANM